MAGELAHELEAAGVRGVGVVLGEVGPEVPVRDGPGQGVDETKHVAVGIGVEPDRRRDFDPAEDEGETREEAMDVMAEAGTGLVHQLPRTQHGEAGRDPRGVGQQGLGGRQHGLVDHRARGVAGEDPVQANAPGEAVPSDQTKIPRSQDPKKISGSGDRRGILGSWDLDAATSPCGSQGTRPKSAVAARHPETAEP